MKVFKSLILSVFLLSIITQSFFRSQTVSAQSSCDACQNAPLPLDKYIKVMQNNTAKLLYVKKKDESASSLTNAARATRDVLNQAQAVLLLGEILFAAPGDIFSDLKNVFRFSLPLKRERDELLTIDKRISDATLALIQQSDYNQKVSPEAAALLEDTFKEMGGWIKLKKDSDGKYNIITQGTTYRELAKFLWGLNMMVKHNHSRRWYTDFLADVGQNANITIHNPNDAMTDQQKVDAEGLSKTWTKVNAWRDFLVKKSVTQNNQRSSAQEWLALDPEMTVFRVRQIEQQYQCAEGLKNECSDLRRVRQENWKLTKDMIVTNSKSAMTTIIDATQRLGALLHIGSQEQIDAVNQRKRALLQSQRGSETDKRLETGYVNKAMSGIKSLWKKIAQSEQKSQDPANSSKSNELFGAKTPAGSKESRGHPNPLTYDTPEQMLDFIHTIKDRFDKEPKLVDGSDAFNLHTNQDEQDRAMRKNLISQSVLAVLSTQDTLVNKAVFHDPSRVTQKFPALSSVVYQNIDTIGRKNQENTLVQNIGKVCEMQCTNLQGKCWGIED